MILTSSAFLGCRKKIGWPKGPAPIVFRAGHGSPDMSLLRQTSLGVNDTSGRVPSRLKIPPCGACPRHRDKYDSDPGLPPFPHSYLSPPNPAEPAGCPVANQKSLNVFGEFNLRIVLRLVAQHLASIG